VQQGAEMAGELVGGHVVGVAAKARVAPGSVGRVGARTTKAPEPGEVAIGDSGFGQVTRERVSDEVGMAARAGEASHVGDTLDAVSAQQRHELLERARRVADCKHLYMGPPTWPPIPPRLGPPRRSRGDPRYS